MVENYPISKSGERGGVMEPLEQNQQCTQQTAENKPKQQQMLKHSQNGKEKKSIYANSSVT